MTQTIKILSDLKRAKNKGISALNYPKGTRLGARIYDLREAGNEIKTFRKNETQLARYVLVSAA